MWKLKLWMVTFLLLLLAGCQSSELPTPTPFPPTPVEISLAAGGSPITPVPAVLADIMANPEFYEGAHVLVTGQYFRGPLRVCATDPQPSPAGWELAAGETRIPAGGFDEQLRQLIPDGMTLTIIGRLTYWQGPVGCGKQAVPTEMWYLDVVRMVDPAQLALVTLTPGFGTGDLISDGGIADELFTPMAVPETRSPAENDSPATAPPAAPPTNTPPPTVAVPIETLGAGFTPVPTDAIASTPTVSSTVTAVATAQPTSATPATPGVSTVTNTPSPGASSTPTTSPMTTATADAPFVTSMGESGLETEDFAAAELKSAEIHEWTMPLDEGDAVIVSAVGEPGIDIKITILDENLDEVAAQDGNSTGEAELLPFAAADSGDYKIRISDINGRPGGYLLAIGIEEYRLLPQGMLSYGSARSSVIFVDELHYWFFMGAQNDVIDLALSSESGANLVAILFDSDGQYIELGEIENITLPESGWYVVELEEWGLDENSYQITVSKQ